MIFHNHSELKGTHAMFSASQYAWLRYSLDDMIEKYQSSFRKIIGTELHEFAATQIQLFHKFTSVKSIKENFETFIYKKYYDEKYETINDFGKKILVHFGYLPNEVLETLKAYINDAVRYRMETEKTLCHSELFYGTADAILFRDNFLRIHDLKTGATPAKMEQLKIYAALFCLEYDVKPYEIKMELRIYQNNEVLFYNPEPQEIRDIMDFIIERNRELEKIVKEVI